MSKTFPNLFTPVRIGKIDIRNRILSTGHDTSIPTGGAVNDALIAYHEARAKGGAGLIVVQVAGIHESARYTSHILMATGDACIPGYARLAEAVHAHGAKIFAQLFHPGREIIESQDGSAPVAYAPSAVPSDRFHCIPRALTRALIGAFVAGFGAGARRIEAAGIDGVEIVASHGYLPAQFLNPQVNLRQDGYGGSFENRLRFLREVIAEIRKSVGNDFVVGLRISGDEKEAEGLTEADSLAAIIALAPGLDYVNVIAGSSAKIAAAAHIVPPMFVEGAYVAPFAAAVKQAVAIPVLVAGRINQPQQAEQVIASGQADMCGMTRAMICDPEMAAKAEAGHSDDIRACIGCNQACIGHMQMGFPISCIQHPETGRELTYGELRKAETPREVLVVGGGPGGLKAASVAARRGHRVVLCEAAPRLGGQALLAQLLPGRAEFGGIVTNLAHEAARAGVEVRLNTPVDRALVESMAPDAVIVATGAGPRRPGNLGLGDAAQVVDAWQVLRGEVNPGASVVVADWRCDWVGLGVAERLAESGCRVRLAVNGRHAGEMIQSYVRDMMVARCHRLGVEIIPYARLHGADADTVYLEHSASGEAMLLEGVDTLVLAHGAESEDGLLAELEGYGGLVRPIGDCLAPRTAEEAVFDGLRAAWAL
ncbi:MAG: FAD-dependent oxidoreductase [Proteobacteria bacterium]|nr:FAD-dependent oxidoreductase [Pseudomonadota bacterium]